MKFSTYILLLALGCSLVSCKTTDTQVKDTSTRPADTSLVELVLWDAKGGATALPNNDACKNALMEWVATHPHAQEKFTNEAPRFLLLSVKASRITDTIPIAPTAAGKPLTEADCASLKSCFKGGMAVKVNLGTRTVTL